MVKCSATGDSTHVRMEAVTIVTTMYWGISAWYCSCASFYRKVENTFWLVRCIEIKRRVHMLVQLQKKSKKLKQLLFAQYELEMSQPSLCNDSCVSENSFSMGLWSLCVYVCALMSILCTPYSRWRAQKAARSALTRSWFWGRQRSVCPIRWKIRCALFWVVFYNIF